MDILELRELCLSLPETEETLPFNETTLVYKVAGKMFAMTDMEHSESVTLKCDPELGIILRDRYDEISEAYHMNKKHWITVGICGDLPSDMIRELVRHSYVSVISKFPRNQHERFAEIISDSERSSLSALRNH